MVENQLNKKKQQQQLCRKLLRPRARSFIFTYKKCRTLNIFENKLLPDFTCSQNAPHHDRPKFQSIFNYKVYQRKALGKKKPPHPTNTDELAGPLKQTPTKRKLPRSCRSLMRRAGPYGALEGACRELCITKRLHFSLSISFSLSLSRRLFLITPCGDTSNRGCSSFVAATVGGSSSSSTPA